MNKDHKSCFMMNAHTDDIQLVQLYRQSISAEHVKQKLRTDKNILKYSFCNLQYVKKKTKEKTSLFPSNVIIINIGPPCMGMASEI